MNELTSAAQLMQWLRVNRPDVRDRVRGFASPGYFHAYMRAFTGVTQALFDSHDHACAAYLEALAQGEQIKPEDCCCGEPEASGVVHRTDAPCYYEDSPEVDTTWRPALTWADSKPFDAFKALADWTVQSETHPDEPTPIHALQRLAEGDPRCGSAWLLGR